MSKSETNTSLVLQPKAYDFLKKLAQIWLPAVGTLYFALAALWGLPAADKVTGTIVALDTFLGVMLNVSKNQYVASGAIYDGSVKVIQNTEGAAARFSLDPQDLVHKKSITLKVEPSKVLIKPPDSPE